MRARARARECACVRVGGGGIGEGGEGSACVRVCVRACLRMCACVRAFMRACVRACVRACMCGWVGWWMCVLFGFFICFYLCLSQPVKADNCHSHRRNAFCEGDFVRGRQSSKSRVHCHRFSKSIVLKQRTAVSHRLVVLHLRNEMDFFHHKLFFQAVQFVLR